MTAPFQSDDPLATLFLPASQGPAVPLRYRSGVLTAWDVKDGTNTVSVDGELFTNLPVMPGTYLGILAVNDVVSLLSTTDSRGITTYVIAGMSLTPPDIRLGRAAHEDGMRYDINATQGNVTSTSYTTALTAGQTPQVVFRTMTGKVIIHWGCYLVNGTVNALSYMSFEIRQGNLAGSGTVVLAADDARAIINRDDSAGTGDDQHGWSYPVSNLTPGDWYNVQGMFRCSAGAGVTINRTIIVDPK